MDPSVWTVLYLVTGYLLGKVPNSGKNIHSVKHGQLAMALFVFIIL